MAITPYACLHIEPEGDDADDAMANMACAQRDHP
jgi:hypothetical protein